MNLLDHLLAPFTNEGLFLEILWQLGVAILLVVSLDLIVGYAGRFQLGHIGFFALGALGSLYGAHPAFLGLDFIGGALLGMLFTLAACLLIGIPTLRLAGDYFGIATLGFAFVTQLVLIAFYSNGVYGIPTLNPTGCDLACLADTRLGGALGGGLAFVLGLDTVPNPVQKALEILLVYGLVVVVYVALGRIKRSPFGRVLKSVREDPVAAQALGKDVAALRLKAFIVSGLVASLAGSLWVHHYQNMAPVAYGFSLMVLILVMAILGGLGSHVGALTGAVVATALDQLVRGWTGWLAAGPGARTGFDFPSLRIVLFATLLLLVILLRPQGLLGDREFSLRDVWHRLRRVRPRARGAKP